MVVVEPNAIKPFTDYIEQYYSNIVCILYSNSISDCIQEHGSMLNY